MLVRWPWIRLIAILFVIVSLCRKSLEAAVGDLKLEFEENTKPDIIDDIEDDEDNTPQDSDFMDNDFEAILDIVQKESSTASSIVHGGNYYQEVFKYPQNQYCIKNPFEFHFPDDKEGRSLQSGLGWAAATAIMIFAFSNTVIVGATLVISYILYQVVIMALAVIAPGVATVFVKFMSLFNFL